MIDDVVDEDDEWRIMRHLMSHRLAVFGDHVPKGLGVNYVRDLECILFDPVTSLERDEGFHLRTC